MGRNLSHQSQSPVGVRGSPHMKSPSQRDRSLAWHRSSHRDSSPAREKRPTPKSSKREMSPSPSPPRHRSSRRDGSPPARENNPSHTKSPRRDKSHSPSPRTKRLRRAQAEREAEKVIDRHHGKGDNKDTRLEIESEKVTQREHERNYGKGGDKSTRRERKAEKLTEKEHERNHGLVSEKNMHRDRGADRETAGERRERRSGKDDNDGKSSRASHRRSTSPVDRNHRSKRRSHSPQLTIDSREHDEATNTRGAERWNDDDDSLAKMKVAEEALEVKQKQKPSFELSGKLAAETNRVRGITLLFSEPPDARKPDIRWRLYVFKGGEVLNEPLYIHRQTCYLFGRERRVADIPTDHPSCSKQHAVIQFRQVENEQPDGTLSKKVRPYLMDLGSTNKTYLNDGPIEPQRYYELFEKDTIKFGNSSREYVLLHENSAA